MKLQFHLVNNNYALETFMTLARQLSLGFGDGKLVIGQSGFTRSILYEIDKLIIKNTVQLCQKNNTTL